MAASTAKLDLLLNSIEENCTPTKCQDLLVPFMIDCAALIEGRMPAVALASFRLSNEYAAGRVSIQPVSDALRECWGELQKEGREMHLDDPEVSAIRAVICILKRQLEPESDDFLDFTSFFLHLVNNVEPHPDQQEVLLRRHFASCVGEDD